MSRLDELINELCPDGVEYKCLGDIGQVKMCKRILKSQTNTNGGIPFYKIGTFGGEANAFISEELFQEYREKYSYPKVGEILISAAGTIGRTVVYDGEPAYYQDSNIVWLAHDESNILNTFLRYCYELKPWNISSGGTIARLYNDNILKAKVPVPPLEVQREIVHILDSFTLLTAELTAELTARKKQYEFYRDELLSAKKNIPIVKLGDIAIEFYRGSGIKRDEITDTGIPCIRYGEIYTTYNTWFNKCVSHTKIDFVQSPKYFENGDILFAITGESVEDIAKSVAYIGHEKCLAGGDIVVMKHNQNPRYLAHVLATTEARMQKSKGKVKSKVVHSNVSSIKEIQIPLPPLEVQERYANVLDNFESICTDLNIGLPAEIEARQKQYEYYRDLLLIFAETGSTLMTDRQTDRQTELSAIKLIQYVFGYVSIELGAIATVTKLAGYEFTKYVTYSDEGKIIALRGLNVKNGKLDLTDVKYIDKSDLTKLNRSKLCSGDMLFTYVGTIGQVAVINENDKYYLAPNVALIRVDTQFVNPEYMRYFFQTNVFWDTQINRLLQSSSMKNIPMEKIRKFILQIPSMEEQNRIVEVLNRFDTLCNDLSTGLPAEIEARQKQYEYYRDKLLSFKELPK